MACYTATITLNCTCGATDIQYYDCSGVLQTIDPAACGGTNFIITYSDDYGFPYEPTCDINYSCNCSITYQATPTPTPTQTTTPTPTPTPTPVPPTPTPTPTSTPVGPTPTPTPTPTISPTPTVSPTPGPTPTATPIPPTPTIAPTPLPAWLRPSDIYGFSINGNTRNTGISGYTFATPFNCTIDIIDGATEALVTSLYNVVWWWGDGTTSTEYNPTHYYTWPGVYEIKLGLYNSLSATTTPPYIRTFSVTVTANNYVEDNLTWDYSQWPDLSGNQTDNGACFHGYQSSKSGTRNGPIPIVLNYFTNVKENSAIKLQFYAQNSLSQPWTEVPPSQLVNTRPRWRFTTVSAGPLEDGYVIPEEGVTPLSSTEIRILSSGTLSSTGTLVGLSGTYSFYYIDDTPSLVVSGFTDVLQASANATIIWVTLDTSSIPNYQDYEYINVPSYSNSMVSLSSYYYVQTLLPDHLGITLDGKLDFYNNHWLNVEGRFVTTFNSYSGTDPLSGYLANKVLLNQPTNIRDDNGPSTFFMGYSAQHLDGIGPHPLPFAIFNLSTNPASSFLDYQFSKQGSYIGTFTPYTSANIGVLNSVGPLIGSGNLYYTTDLLPNVNTGFNPIFIPTNTYVLSSYTSSSSATVIRGRSIGTNIPVFNTTYFTRKFGGGFDYGALLKQYALQPTINQNEVFFNDYIPAVAGVSATYDDTYGGVTFEKIANYVANISDPSTTNVAQFYSLAKSLGLDLDNFDYDIPPTLSRVVDLYSTQQSMVWGARSQFARNFANKTGHTNLGVELSAYNVYTTTVTAGQKIVVQDLFNTERFELLEVPAITTYDSITARNLQYLLSAYQSATYPLTTYPLSGFFGWGLKTPVYLNYRFYKYYGVTDNEQKEGLVNWDDPYTTLSEASGASHAEWVKDEGILETIFNYYIHKGLGLIK
jgi:hypothetical protein